MCMIFNSVNSQICGTVEFKKFCDKFQYLKKLMFKQDSSIAMAVSGVIMFKESLSNASSAHKVNSLRCNFLLDEFPNVKLQQFEILS